MSDYAYEVRFTLPGKSRIRRGDTVDVQSPEGTWRVLVDDVYPPEDKFLVDPFAEWSTEITGRAVLIEEGA